MRFALIWCLTVGFPTVVVGQLRWERQVRDRVQRAVTAIGTSSRLPVVERSGMLNTDESGSFEAIFVRRTPYVIIAVCDDDCARLQLTLLKPGGSEIAKERNSESLPTLHFTSDTTMAYGIRVTMEGCHWNPCWYAVAVVPLGGNPR